jgi:hypothetical protein
VGVDGLVRSQQRCAVESGIGWQCCRQGLRSDFGDGLDGGGVLHFPAFRVQHEYPQHGCTLRDKHKCRVRSAWCKPIVER